MAAVNESDLRSLYVGPDLPGSLSALAHAGFAFELCWMLGSADDEFSRLWEFHQHSGLRHQRAAKLQSRVLVAQKPATRRLARLRQTALGVEAHKRDDNNAQLLDEHRQLVQQITRGQSVALEKAFRNLAKCRRTAGVSTSKPRQGAAAGGSTEPASVVAMRTALATKKAELAEAQADLKSAQGMKNSDKFVPAAQLEVEQAQAAVDGAKALLGIALKEAAKAAAATTPEQLQTDFKPLSHHDLLALPREQLVQKLKQTQGAYDRAMSNGQPHHHLMMELEKLRAVTTPQPAAVGSKKVTILPRFPVQCNDPSFRATAPPMQSLMFS